MRLSSGTRSLDTSAWTAAAEPPGASGRGLAFMLGAVVRAYADGVDRATEEVPGGPRGHQILEAATRETVHSQIALADRLGIDRNVMVRLLDGLESAGLVERRTDPADRRKRQVVATGQGRELCRVTGRKLQLVQDRMLGDLTRDEQDVLRKLMLRLSVRADDAASIGRSDRADNGRDDAHLGGHR